MDNVSRIPQCGLFLSCTTMLHWKSKAGLIAALSTLVCMGLYMTLIKTQQVRFYMEQVKLNESPIVPGNNSLRHRMGQIRIHPTTRYEEVQVEKAVQETSTDTHIAAYGGNVLFPLPVVNSSTILFFNRVPKCGSTSIHAMISAMKEVNDFSYKVSINYTHGAKHLSRKEQRRVVDDVMERQTPLVYNRHIHYINFTRFGSPQPMYMNIIRDPMERFMSGFYYRIKRRRHPKIWNLLSPEMDSEELEETISRLNSTFDECVLERRLLCNHVTDYFVLIPYFCGQDNFCLEPSAESLAVAKSNLVKHYILVGLTEDILTFVEGLENLLPYFFKGARSWFEKENPRENAYGKSKTYNQTTMEYMSDKLKEEYEFYNFAKQHFYQKVTYWRSFSRVSLQDKL